MKLSFDFIKNVDKTKAFGIAATLLGLGATMLNNAADQKKLDDIVDKKVAEKLADKFKDQ